MTRETDRAAHAAREGRADPAACATRSPPGPRSGDGGAASRSPALVAAGRAAARGERDLAAIDATRVLAASPKDGRTAAAALHVLGVVLMQRDRFDLAARFLERAVHADPTNGSYAAHLQLVRREARDAPGPPRFVLVEHHPLDRPGYLSLESLSACARLVGLDRLDILRLGGPFEASIDLPGVGSRWEWTDAVPLTGWASEDPSPASHPAGAPARDGHAAATIPHAAARFDLVYACGVIEHLVDVPAFLEEAARVLRPGGALFAEVRPLWSSAAGHHLSVLAPDGTRVGGTLEGAVPRWCHLFWTDREMAAYLSPIIGAAEAGRIAHTVYRTAWLNRLLEDDLIALVNRSPLLIERLESLLIDPLTARLDERLRAAYPGRRQFAARGLRAVLRKPD